VATQWKRCTDRTYLVRPTFKPRKATSLRKTFVPTSGDEDEDTEATGVFTPLRPHASKSGLQRNAARRSAFASSQLSRQRDDAERPSYSATYLQELKESTPTTPRDLTTDTSAADLEDVTSDTQALDIASKFGTSLSRYQDSSAIPSAAEITEKKARRARLAQEHTAEEYISLDPSDPELDEDDDDNVTRDEYGRLVLKPKDKYNKGESRLVREDEDIMENFDEFTEADGQILFSRAAESEAAQRRKVDMAARIAEAEGASDSDSNASERERNEAFEAAQTKHGTYGTHDTPSDPYAAVRPKTPPIISPLPTLDGVLAKLRQQIAQLQTSRMQKVQEMESLQREKVRLGQEEVRIQKALKETAERFQALRAEKGIAPSITNGNLSVSAPAIQPAGTPVDQLLDEIDSTDGNEMIGLHD